MNSRNSNSFNSLAASSRCGAESGTGPILLNWVAPPTSERSSTGRGILISAHPSRATRGTIGRLYAGKRDGSDIGKLGGRADVRGGNGKRDGSDIGKLGGPADVCAGKSGTGPLLAIWASRKVA